MKHLAKVMSLAVALAMTAEMVPAQQQTHGQQPQAQQKQNDHSRAKGGPKHAH
jgi:hypothetical protein